VLTSQNVIDPPYCGSVVAVPYTPPPTSSAGAQDTITSDAAIRQLATNHTVFFLIAVYPPSFVVKQTFIRAQAFQTSLILEPRRPLPTAQPPSAYASPDSPAEPEYVENESVRARRCPYYSKAGDIQSAPNSAVAILPPRFAANHSGRPSGPGLALQRRLTAARIGHIIVAKADAG